MFDQPQLPRRSGASLSTGAYKLVPVPFLDDWLIRKHRERVIRSLLKAQKITYDPEVPGILSGGAKTLSERLVSIAKGLLLKPIKKLLRTVLFWISIRAAARTALSTLLLTRFVQLPSFSQRFSEQHLTKDEAILLAQAFVTASTYPDHRVIAKSLRSLAQTLARSPSAEEAASDNPSRVVEPGLLRDFDKKATKLIQEL